MKAGFIGAGNMGSALALALYRSKPETEILITDHNSNKCEALCQKIRAEIRTGKEIAQSVDYLFLAVKPQMLEEAISEIREEIQKNNHLTIVTMAAGTSIEKVRSYIQKDLPILRIMPNTPAGIGEGVILYCANPLVSEDAMMKFLKAMEKAGICIPLAENKMDAGSAVSGCGPAFVDLFVEALADGGVACGLPRASAQKMAAQMVKGAAQLILESGKVRRF